MADTRLKELRRRSLVKSLMWRVIGVAWTWIGAYIILILVPPSHRTAALIATLIVVYHHSTRMIMYYIYERIWASVAWGRVAAPSPMSRRERVLWSAGTTLALAIIFFLLLEVHPRVKPDSDGNRSAQKRSESMMERPTGATYSTSTQGLSGSQDPSNPPIPPSAPDPTEESSRR